MEWIVSEAWKRTCTRTVVGMLAMRDVANPDQHPELEERKAELEKDLRARFAGDDRPTLRALPVLQAYHTYYKRFDKTYHVQLQLESVVLKGKGIPRSAALVECMFMAELKNLLLTAGHDLDTVCPPLRIDVSDGSQAFVRLDGREQQLKAGDLLIADAEGILSSVLCGPDSRTCIRPETRRVLFTVYGVPGIGKQAVREHLEEIRANVVLVAPGAQVESLEVVGTG